MGKAVDIRVNTNIEEPEILAEALGAVAHEYGIAELVRKSISVPTTENIIPEQWMQTVLDRLNERYKQQMHQTYQNLIRWSGIQFGTIKKSATPDPTHLTPMQLEELREILRANFYGMGMIGPDVASLWKQYGLKETEWEFLLHAIKDSFLISRYVDITDMIQMGASYDEMIFAAQKRPLLRHDQLALEASLRNTRIHLRKLWDTVSEDIMGTVSVHEAEQVSGVINQYMSGELPLTRYSPVGGAALNTGELEAIQTLSTAKTENTLRGELWNYFKFDPKNRGRDWWRVAVTDTRAASGIGRFMQMDEQGRESFYMLVQPDACKQCRAAYLEASGQPKIFTLGPVLNHALQTHGMNIDKKHKGLPNASLHPHCNCIPFAYVKGAEMLTIGAQ